MKTRKKYNTIREAATDLNVSYTDMQFHIAGKLKQIRGCTVEKVSDVKPINHRKTTKPALRKRVKNTENGHIYASLTIAAQTIGVSISALQQHVVRRKPQRIRGATYDYHEPVEKMKQVRCIETGTVYQSVRAASADTGVTENQVVHVLKGRTRRAGRWSFCYDDAHDVTMNRPSRSRQSSPRRIVFDDSGRWFLGFAELARAKGITAARARTLVLRDEEGIYRCHDLFAPLKRP